MQDESDIGGSGGEEQSPDELSERELLSTSTALDTYFHALSRKTLLSREDELELARLFSELISEFRFCMSGFAFVAQDHLRFLSGLNMNDVERYFVHTLDGSDPESAQSIICGARDWSMEIYKSIKSLSCAFHSEDAKAVGHIRGHLRGVIMRHTASVDQIEEWWQVAQEYLAVAKVLKSLEGTPQLQEELVRRKLFAESKLMMRLDEFSDTMKVIQRAREKAYDIRAKIVDANLRLVVSVVKRFQEKGVPLDDLIQEGNLGLIKAVDRFDHRKGHKLSTYATWWIRLYAKRAVEKQARTIRIPIHMLEYINRMFAVEQAYIRENGAEPTERQLADILEITESRLRAIRKMALQTVSLQSSLGDDEGSAKLGDYLESPTGSPLEDMLKTSMRESLNAVLETLSEREQMILRMRYGLIDDVPQTLEDVASHFKLTKERIRQIEIKALKKIKLTARRSDFY